MLQTLNPIHIFFLFTIENALDQDFATSCTSNQYLAILNVLYIAVRREVLEEDPDLDLDRVEGIGSDVLVLVLVLVDLDQNTDELAETTNQETVVQDDIKKNSK